MTPFVLDNSVSAAWCFEDQSTAYTDSILQTMVSGRSAIVPTIWPLEVANVLVVAERRKKVTLEASAKYLRDLQTFSITVDRDGVDRAFDGGLELARLHRRSSYDAAYLELAKRRRLPFATKDMPLKQAQRNLA